MFDANYIQRLERLSIAVKRGRSEIAAGMHASPRKGFGIEFEDYRTYSIGDDLRYVDWNIYGRTEMLFTKQYREEKQVHLTILLDRSASMDTGRHNKFRAACRLAGALGYIALAGFDKLSVHPFSSGIDDTRHLSGKNMGPALFRFLSGVRPKGKTDLREAFLKLVRRTTGKGMAVVLSDFLGAGGYEAALRALRRQRYEVHVLHLEDEQDRDPRFDGSVLLTDSETRETLEADLTAGARAAYRRAYSERIERLARWCGANEIAYLRVDSAELFDAVAQKLLRPGRLLA